MQVRFYLFALLLSAGCKPDPDPRQTEAKSYIPIQEGASSDFDVIRTIYSPSAAPETRTFQTRQVTGTPYRDQNGQDIYPISHYVFSDSNWRVDSVSLIWRSNKKIMSNEHGQVIVKLSEPIAERNFWDGNAYNVSGMQLFTLVNVGWELQIGNDIFPNTITVVRQDDSTLLSRKRILETFAEGIGLIKREITMVSYCYAADCKGKGIVQNGIAEISTIKRSKK